MKKTAIDIVLDNAFIIKRQATKHIGIFKFNKFERPLTHLDFFNILAINNLNLSSAEASVYMCARFAKDYINNWKSDIKLVVCENSAQIIWENHEHKNINLNFEMFTSVFKYFRDSSIYNTDYRDLQHLKQYYIQ